MTELINFVLIAMTEFVALGKDLPEDASTGVGVIFDTRRQSHAGMGGPHAPCCANRSGLGSDQCQ